MLERLLEAFGGLPDPRREGKTRHLLIDVLVIAVCAVIAGAEMWIDIALYGRSKEAWLRTFLKLENGIPSHDTFRRVFTIIDQKCFEQHFYQWVSWLYQPTDREVIAVDGKTVRRSFNRKKIKEIPL